MKFGQAGWGEIKDGQGLAVSVKSGMVELELAPLLSGNLVVREVRLDNPVLEVREGKAVSGQDAPPLPPFPAPSPEPSRLPMSCPWN